MSFRWHRSGQSLTKEQGQIWREIVDALPATWFRPEMLPMLETYCVSLVRAREIAAQVAALGKSPEPSDAYFKLLDRENLAHRAILLATKLRLTPQSAYLNTKARPEVLRKPWEGR
jgi:hypothetical protein